MDHKASCTLKNCFVTELFVYIGSGRYKQTLYINRNSGKVDQVLCTITEEQFNALPEEYLGKFFYVEGIVKTINKTINTLDIVCEKFSLMECPETKDTNTCELAGIICSQPKLRDAIGAHNKDNPLKVGTATIKIVRNNRADYIPLLLFGGTAAHFEAHVKKGDEVHIIGRLESKTNLEGITYQNIVVISYDV